MDVNANNEDLRDSFDHSNDSGTPLNCASSYKNVAAVQHLLKREADPEAGDLPPTAHAIGNWDREKFLPALPALFEAGASANKALDTAVLLGDVEAA